MSSNQRQVLKKIFCINFLLPRRWSVCIRHCITWPPLFLLSLFQNWTSRVLKKQMAIPMESLAAAQVGTASRLSENAQGGVHSRRPSTQRVQLMPSALYWR